MKKKYVTYKDIMSDNPCYDPQEIGMPTNYKATVAEFIQEYRGKVRKTGDIFWVLLRSKYLTKSQAVWFSLKCAKRVKHLIIGQRAINVLNVTERYLKGEATEEELVVAKNEADAAYGYRINFNENNIYLLIYYATNLTKYSLVSYADYASAIARDTVNYCMFSINHLFMDVIEEINAQIDILLEILK